MGGDGNGCGIGLLGVTSNESVIIPRRTAFALRAHAAPSAECNYYICAIYLGWAKCVCIKQSLLYSSTLHSSTGHSCFLCSLILSCVLFTQLWSGINSWFWHTLWVSTLYYTSTDGSIPFVYDSRDVPQGLHSRDMPQGLCIFVTWWHPSCCMTTQFTSLIAKLQKWNMASSFH